MFKMNEHITRLEVKNFKKFDHLVVENIGQVNLITGDNNVGKTSLLEVILIANNDSDEAIKYLHRTLCWKGVHIHPENINKKNPILPQDNYFDYIKHTKNNPVTICWGNNYSQNKMVFEDCYLTDLTEKDLEKRKPDLYGIGNPNLWIRIYKNGIFDELQWMYLDDFKRGLKYGYWPFVSMSAGFAMDINQFYKENIGLDVHDNNARNKIAHQQSLFEENFKALNFEEKKRFIASLSLFVSDIEDTAIKNYFGRDMLSVKIKSFEDYRPITFWGEGFNVYVRYLLEIVKNKNKFLSIDEFGEGVHWTKMKEFWINIIQSCEQNNVQLFCTSHSQDCITAFVEAAEGMDEMKSKIRLIELEAGIKNKDSIYANTYDFENIKSSLESKVNLRGGDIYA